MFPSPKNDTSLCRSAKALIDKYHIPKKMTSATSKVRKWVMLSVLYVGMCVGSLALSGGDNLRHCYLYQVVLVCFGCSLID